MLESRFPEILMPSRPKKPAGFRRISDEAVQEATGKSWQQWFVLLDGWGARRKGHSESARHLRQTYKTGSWWAQAVTIRYEYERGLRQ